MQISKFGLGLAVLLLVRPLAAGVPDDLETAFQNLKQAESKKDAAQVKRLAAEASKLAREVTSVTTPPGDVDPDTWKKQVAFARDVELYSEYALSALALQSAPAVTVDLLSTLEQQNPKSKYLDDAYTRYLVALSQTGGSSKIIPVAEKAIRNFPNNEDLLLVLADNAMTTRQIDRAIQLSERLVGVLGTHPKPDNMSAADWDRKKTAALGRAHWIDGMMHAEKAQYFQVDKELRAALPFIQGNDAMLGPALFQLGVANYQLGSVTRNRAQVFEAIKFSEQAAAIKGPLSTQAWRNAQAMKTEAGRMR